MEEKKKEETLSWPGSSIQRSYLKISMRTQRPQKGDRQMQERRESSKVLCGIINGMCSYSWLKLYNIFLNDL